MMPFKNRTSFRVTEEKKKRENDATAVKLGINKHKNITRNSPKWHI